MNIEKEHFEQWLYSQPRDKKIDLSSSDDCLLCRFIKETTNHNNPRAFWELFILDWKGFSLTAIELIATHSKPIPDWFKELVNPNLEHCWVTYGQMQDRFRSIFPKEPEPIPEPTEPCLT